MLLCHGTVERGAGLVVHPRRLQSCAGVPGGEAGVCPSDRCAAPWTSRTSASAFAFAFLWCATVRRALSWMGVVWRLCLGMKWPPRSWALMWTWLNQAACGPVLKVWMRSSAVWMPGGFPYVTKVRPTGACTAGCGRARGSRAVGVGVVAHRRGGGVVGPVDRGVGEQVVLGEDRLDVAAVVAPGVPALQRLGARRGGWRV